MLILGCLASCATERPFVWIQDLPPIAIKGEGLIHPRDAIVVSVRDQAALSGEFVVRDDGGVLLPTIGDVMVNGRTPDNVAEEVKTRLANLVVKPLVTVSISRVASIRVNVVGEVKTPGSYELTRDRSVAAALAAAGWLGDFAARDRIFVIRRGEDDFRVRFRADEITTPAPTVARFRLCDGDVVAVE
jgi:polysaccharide export outer membrane protein